MKNLFLAGLVLLLLCQSAFVHSQVDTEFWFVVPELSYRENTGGSPGYLQIATLEQAAHVNISMPANQYHPTTNPTGFEDIILEIDANSSATVDLSYLIDNAANPGITGLENKVLTPSGINDFGLHITSTNRITAYWEVNYEYGSDVWTLKGSKGLGNLFYTPFQTTFNNRANLPISYSAIDIVATEDNTTISITLPPGKEASYGSLPVHLSAGGTHVVILNRGETFSLFPLNYSLLAADHLAGTRIESTSPVSVTVKDDAVAVGAQGRDVIGDQLVPVDQLGDQYIVPEMKTFSDVYVLATEDSTNIFVFAADGTFIGPVPYTNLDKGEQAHIVIPNGSKFVRITSSLNPEDPYKPFYLFQLGAENAALGGALVPPYGCSGNTSVAFTRAREDDRFYFYLLTEKGNEDKFLIDGVRDDIIIAPSGFVELQGSGGWSAYFSSSVPASKFTVGQHEVQNTGGVFHMGILNGSPGGGNLHYGFYTDFGGLTTGAEFAGTNATSLRACLGDPVALTAYGGTDYTWTPGAYMNDPNSSNPIAAGLPSGAHKFTVNISGACASDEIDLTLIVADTVAANAILDENSICNGVEVSITDSSKNGYSWMYIFSDGSPDIIYDNDDFTPQTSPPDPFTITKTFTNNGSEVRFDTITLLVKNESGCADIKQFPLKVYPEIESGFTADVVTGCHPLEVFFNDNSLNAANYLWDFGDGSTSTLPSPSHTFINTGSVDSLYRVKLITSTSDGLCKDSTFMDINVHPHVMADFNLSASEGCTPLELSFENLSVGAVIINWDFGDGTTSNSTDDQVHVYMNPSYNQMDIIAKLHVENNAGCVSEVSRSISVFPAVSANFDASDTSGCSPLEILYVNNSQGASLYHWNFGDGNTSDLFEPMHIYENLTPDNLTFQNRLVVTSVSGCSDTLIENVTVYPQSIGGELGHDEALIIYGASTGDISLSNNFGDVMLWQRSLGAADWEDIAHTGNIYSEIPSAAGEWKYRAEVKKGICPAAYSSLAEISVQAKEVQIIPDAGQYKLFGESDPVFSFTNSEWGDNTTISGELGRESGEEAAYYAYSMNTLNAGANYMLQLDTGPKFEIRSSSWTRNHQSSEDPGLEVWSARADLPVKILYFLPTQCKVDLLVRNITGQVISYLENDHEMRSGVHILTAEDLILDQGIYFVTMKARSDQGSWEKTVKFVR